MRQEATTFHWSRHLLHLVATFPEKLNALMDRAGLTTRDVGRAVDLDHSAVARWLKGTRPYRSSIAKLADFFAVPVDLLLDDSKELPAIETAQRVEEPAGKYHLEKIPPGIDPDSVRRLAEGIAWLEGRLARLQAEHEARLKQIAEQQAANDAEFRALPGVADALAAGLTMEDLREMVRAEIKRRRKKKKKKPAKKGFSGLVPVSLPSQTQALSTETGKPIHPPSHHSRSA